MIPLAKPNQNFRGKYDQKTFSLDRKLVAETRYKDEKSTNQW